MAYADPVLVLDVYEKLSPHVIDALMSECVVMAPQQQSCVSCNGTLEIQNRVIDVRYFGVNGLERRKKLTLRCSRRHCRIMIYHLTTYGKKGNFNLYEMPIDVIETTDGVIIQRNLFEQFCSLQ